MDAAGDLSKTDHSWSSDKFRITPANGEKETDIIDGEQFIPIKISEIKP